MEVFCRTSKYDWLQTRILRPIPRLGRRELHLLVLSMNTSGRSVGDVHVTHRNANSVDAKSSGLDVGISLWIVQVTSEWACTYNAMIWPLRGFFFSMRRIFKALSCIVEFNGCGDRTIDPDQYRPDLAKAFFVVNVVPRAPWGWGAKNSQPLWKATIDVLLPARISCAVFCVWPVHGRDPRNIFSYKHPIQIPLINDLRRDREPFELAGYVGNRNGRRHKISHVHTFTPKLTHALKPLRVAERHLCALLCPSS